MPENTITGTDLAHVVDLVGALWDEHENYVVVLVAGMGPTRGMAAAVGLCSFLLERTATAEGMTRDQILGVVRGEVWGQ